MALQKLLRILSTLEWNDKGQQYTHPVHRLRALIVEDDPADAELIVSELRRSGFEVLWDRVETEEQYLARLAGVPEIVLADYSLPQFNSSRALELLQQQGLESIPDTPTDRANLAGVDGCR